MVRATRVASNKEGGGDGIGKVVGDGNGNVGGKRATAMRAMAVVTTTMWAMATAMMLAGDIDGNRKGGDGDSDKVGGQ
jgi:hypothetical protein